jgi:hypothetical protein
MYFGAPSNKRGKMLYLYLRKLTDKIYQLYSMTLAPANYSFVGGST